MFKVEDAVSVDTSEYELASPGSVSRSPGIVLAVGDGPQPCYHVRLWLPLGTTLDVSVPSDKIFPAHQVQKATASSLPMNGTD